MPRRRRPPSQPKPALPARPLEPGTMRGELVYLPSHPLASKRGWARIQRVEIYAARNGVCVCDANGQQAQWADVKVFVSDGEPMVLCRMHGFLRLLARRIVETGFGGASGVAVAEAMGALWSAPCPPPGVVLGHEESGATEEDPYGATPPSPSHPGSQVEVSA